MSTDGQGGCKNRGPVTNAGSSIDVTCMQARIVDREEKKNNLENQSRKSNVQIDGVPEIPGETWTHTEAKCKRSFTNVLGLDSVSIKRVYRTGEKLDGYHRCIVVKLLSFEDQEVILAKAKEHQPRGIYISSDCSQRVSKIHRELCPQSSGSES